MRVVAAVLAAYRQFQITHLTHLEVVQRVKPECPMQRVKQTSKILLC